MQEVLSTLERITGFKPTKSGSNWKCRCPVHKDAKPSLSVKDTGDTVLLYCFAGCSFDEIVEAIELRSASYSPDEIEEEYVDIPPWERKIVASYDYVDKSGELIAQKVRFEPKDFRIRTRDSSSYHGWKWRKPSRLIPLYNLPTIINSNVVAIVEGEKDADVLSGLGLPATCTIEGGSKGGVGWHEEYNTHFEGKHVLIFPDHDEVGIATSRSIYEQLHGTKSKTLMYPLPGLTSKMDVYDWLALGWGLDDIRRLWKQYRKMDSDDI